MFGIQFRRAGLAVATLALAASVSMTPAAQATSDHSTNDINPITTTPLSLHADEADTALGISGPQILKPGIEVTFLRKVRIETPINKTLYRFDVRNSGNLDFSSGASSAGMCWYQNSDGSFSGVTAWDVSPEWVSSGMEAGKSYEFSFNCRNSLNGKSLHHGVGRGHGFYGQQYNQTVSDDAQSN
jgi:hypothetical protein